MRCRTGCWKWADKELLTFRVQQAERAAVLLGDSVMVLAWNPEKQRPTLRVYDPFFFPSGAMRTRTFPAGCIWRGSCRRTTTPV